MKNKEGRDLRLDLFRGLALVFIFLDHIPANILAWLTIRNFGLSDATEVFIFLSGYSAALAYITIQRRSGFKFALIRILQRTWTLYMTHIFVFVVFMAEVSYIAERLQGSMFIEELQLVRFLEEPGPVMLQVLLLKFKPGLMDPLPLYIAFLLIFPLVLWLLGRSLLLTLAGSATLYTIAHIFDWNLPGYPQGHWFFNPFAWQFLFIIGAVMGVAAVEKRTLLPKSPLLLAGAIIYLLLGLGLVLSWQVPGLDVLVPPVVARLIYPIDKTNLDLLRLLHFLALAYVTSYLVQPDSGLVTSRFSRWLIRCGQHSLEIFCLGIILSSLGHFLQTLLGGSVSAQLVVGIGGICMLAIAAIGLDWYKNVGRQQANRHAHALQEVPGMKE